MFASLLLKNEYKIFLYIFFNYDIFNFLSQVPYGVLDIQKQNF